MKGTQLLLSLAVFLGLPCFGMVIKTDHGFFVNDHNVIHKVKPYDVDPFLRRLSDTQLHKFTDMGNRIKAIQLHNGDYMLRAKGDLNGGGPWLAAITAAVGYPVVGLAALGATIASIPAVGPGCFLVGLGVATSGGALVTKGVIAAAIVPTP